MTAHRQPPISGQKLLVLGNGMVGQRLLETLAANSADYRITVLCEEPRPAYDRVQLSAFFAGKSAADLSLVAPDFFAHNHIDLHLDETAVSIDCQAKRVTTSKNRALEYDQLVLATGSYPFVPPLPGRDRPNCFVYRTLEDLEAIRAGSEGSKSGVVIG